MGSSVISLGLGLGGGKAATSSGRLAGGSPWNGNLYSVSFDGTDDFVDTGNKFDFMQQTLNFTISAWIKYTNHASTSANQYTLHTTDSGGRVGFMLWYDNRHGGKQIRTLISPTSSTKVEVTVNNAITDNNFHHFAVTCAAGGSYTLYIDGSSVGSTPLQHLATSTDSAMHNFTLGAAKTSGGSSTLHFEGNLDEVAIFNSELSASNVTAIYNSGVPNDISSLSPVGWWRMGDNDSGSGTTITDQGSGGNNATLTNGPTFSTTVPT